MRAWREHLGLTQAEAAARLHVSQSAYAQMERRKGGLRHAGPVGRGLRYRAGTASAVTPWPCPHP
ncbi:MAG: helix-turn-helix domain-containing protein [Thermodesulfobacteriota bacterium]